MFVHCPPPGLARLDKITATTAHSGTRVYTTLDGKQYPSVTTVLSLLSRDGIQAWRKKVGEKEANAISSRAAGRGTRIHNLIEKTLDNQDVTPKLPDIEMFRDLRSLLAKRVNNIYLQEKALYSHTLRLAGRCDCIAEYRGVLSVIDFKTSLRPKTPDHIENYFMQACAYGTMFHELFGIEVTQGVIMIGVDNEKPQVFQITLSDWYDDLIKVRDMWELTSRAT